MFWAKPDNLTVVFSFVLTGLPGLNQFDAEDKKCLAQGHDAVPTVKIEPTTTQFRVKHSTLSMNTYHN